MRKKYLSALLFGALLFASAGTFTSCKDYDDDIDNLQQQIDGLATKEDMQAKLDQMQTAVNDAKATAEEALEKANAAGDADKIAELEGRIAELEKTLGDIDAMKEEIQNALDSQIADFREEMEELLKQVEELTGYSLDMVTSIEFQAQNKDGKYDANLNVNYDRVNQILVPKDLLYANNSGAKLEDAGSSYTFGEGLTGAFTVAKGDVNTVTDYMLVNINPANAVISNDMLSLVNGKGTNLNEYVNITSEQWSDDIVKTRATQDNGLRLVGVQLKNDVDFEAFDKLVLTKSNAAHDATGCTGEKDEFIAYALSVTDAEKDRTVTSTYDVTLHVTEEGEAKNIDGKTTIKSSAASASDPETINEWNNGGDATGVSEECFPVATGEAFTINVGSEEGRVMASYVVVDYDKEGLTASDKAALKGLEFSGVDTVLKGEELKHSITINGIEGIAVPLKLVTIDYTGKVQAFNIWVKAGAAVTVNAAYTITPKAAVDNPIRFSIDNQDLLQAFTIPAGATKYTVEFTAGETAHKGDTHVPTVYKTSRYNNINMSTSELKAVRDDATDKGQINQSFLKLYEADKKTPATKLDKVAYAEFTGVLNLQMMREDKAYKGTIRFYNDEETYLGANTIQVTKVLPTAVPADFSAKTNGINNGVMTVYPTPESGTGEFLLKKTFNNWESNFNLTIDGVTTTNPALGTYDKGASKGDASTAMIDDINVDIIQNGESYPATVTYNYGNIKFIPEGHGTIQNPDAYAHIVTWGTSFDMQFNCWPVDCKYQWSETPEVYYGESTELLGKVTKKENADGSETLVSFENVIKAFSPYNKEIDPFSNSVKDDWANWAKDLTQSAKIILITNNNGKDVENEYYSANWATETVLGTTKTTIQLTWKGAQSQPSGDVETKVVLRLTDNFDHEHDIPALTFTMKINHE